VPVPGLLVSRWFQVEIVSIRKGTSYNDVAVSEVIAFGH
jgi:hypothetical protein